MREDTESDVGSICSEHIEDTFLVTRPGVGNNSLTLSLPQQPSLFGQEYFPNDHVPGRRSSHPVTALITAVARR